MLGKIQPKAEERSQRQQSTVNDRIPRGKQHRDKEDSLAVALYSRHQGVAIFLMTTRRSFRQQLFGPASYFVWAAVGILSLAVLIGASTYFRVYDYDEYGFLPLTFLHTLGWQFLVWAPWLAAAGLVYRLSERYPLERPRATIPVHLVAAVAIALVHGVWYVAISSGLSPFVDHHKTRYGVFAFFFVFWFQMDLVIYWLLVGFAWTRQSLERLRERERRAAALELELVGAQLEALKLQIRPHFLFNSLNTIVSMQRAGEHEKALKMTLALSDMLRYLLSTEDDSHEVTLRKDLELLDRYLELEQYRFEGRLTVNRNIDKECLIARVPTLLLQPVVENAIRHGVAKTAGAGEIHIAARREDATLVLDVSNPTSESAAPGGPGLGIALDNTRRRLAELYGDAQRLDITEGHDRATVSICIPWHETAELVIEGARR